MLCMHHGNAERGAPCAKTSSAGPMSRTRRSSTATTPSSAAQESYALWTVANSIEPWHPQPTSQPTLWSYEAMRPLVLQALDLVSPEKAGRRVIALENPGRKGLSACVGWLYTRPAGDAAGRVRHRAQSRLGGAALRDGGRRRLHGGRRPQDGSGRRRFRHHAERHLARPRRRERRRGDGLAGRPRHAAGQPARRQLLRRASGVHGRSRTIRSTTPPRSTAARACCRSAARPGASRTRRCSSTNGAAPTRRW